MKKTVVIILIILIIVLGGLAVLPRNHAAITVVAPETSVPTPPTNFSTPADTSENRAQGPVQKTIAIGASGQLGNVIIKIDSLIQDSRCPTQVTCIQAGSVSVHATVSKGTVAVSHDFISTGTPFMFEGYSIKIVNVTPVPTTGANTVALSDYRVTFEATPIARGDNI
jgi:hypothetical protein